MLYTKFYSKKYFMRGLALGAILLSNSSVAGASESSAEDWQFGASVYAWVPSVDGNLAFTPPNAGGSVDVDVDQIIEDLKMVFLGSFEIRKGKWSGFTDVIYIDLGDSKSKSVTLPDGDTQKVLDAGLDLKSLVWSVAGAYTLWQKEKSHADLFAGARLMALDTDLKLTGTGPQQSNVKLSESVDLWDAIVGVKGRASLNEHWFMPYYFDAGTGDTDFTWQAQAGVGYSFNWGDIVLSYRHLEYDEDDKLLQDLAFSGASLGAVFHW